MRIPLEPGDRKLLIVSGALLVLITVLGLLVSPPAGAPSTGYPSSYSTASDGGKAAYLLLSELGCQVERWTSPPRELPAEPQKMVLVLAEPLIPARAEEKSHLRAFVNAGGRLLLTGRDATVLLPEPGPRYTPSAAPREQNFHALLPGVITRQAPEINMKANSRWRTLEPGHLGYYGDTQGATVVGYRVGKGEVIWWADSTPLTNFGLKQAANLMLFLNSVSAGGTTRVLWDGYFHGQRPGLWSYLRLTPAPWFLAQCAVLAAAALLSFSRRSGPVRALQRESRLSPLEFVETLGELYERKGTAAGALEVAYQRFRFLLLRRLGLPSTATPEEIARGLHQRFGWTDPDFLKVLRLCERGVAAADLPGSRAMQLVQDLHDYARRLRLAEKSRGE